jgi:DNA-binding PadR family transcriptional regulator
VPGFPSVHWQDVTMANRSSRPSPLAVVLLTLLAEAPMHAYRMQQLIEERDKGQIVNVAQRNSIYQTIERLRRDELIAVRETVRDERRPERIVYEITGPGMATLRQWLRAMLAAPAREFPEFPAALACLPMLTPEDVLQQLEARVVALEEAIARVDPQAASEASGLPRLFLVEDEYRHAVMSAELQWVRALIEDLRSGALTWHGEWLQRFAEQAAQPAT